MDLITIEYSTLNEIQIDTLKADLEKYEKDNYRLIIHDNTTENVGFAKGSNLGAEQATTDIIGFINPDVAVNGPFIGIVEQRFADDPDLAITGCAFRPDPQGDYARVGLSNWVCGAAFFVRRDWFLAQGGFDERFVWSWEETDLCLQATKQRLKIEPIDHLLPLVHYGTPPGVQSQADLEYKQFWLREGERLFKEKWGLT